MAPAQHTAGITLNRKPNFSVKVVASGKTKTIQSSSESKGFNCTSNYKCSIVQMERTLNVAPTTKASSSAMDVAVDVTGFARSSDIRLATKDDPDETEYSSSFADTTSGNDNGSGPSDAEAESRFYDDSGLGSSFDGFSGLFPIRKKKLTTHWRDFIRPIMWRCKWAELKMKELQSRAARYKREISAHDRKKHRVLDQATLEESGSKSFPFIHPRWRKKAMKRRKRKRVEDATDIATHMSSHNLFSYFENKKLDLDGTPAGDDFSNAALAEQNTDGQDEFGNHDDLSILESSNGFLEQMLRKIEVVHSRVHKMKDQLDTVMTKNAIKFSSSENLMSFDGQASSIRSPTFSVCNGDAVSAGGLYATSQHMADYDLGDFIMPDSAMSSYGEAMPIPDIIESTVGLLSSVDVTQQQAQVGDSSERIVDNILINNEISEVEGRILTVNQNKSLEKNQDVGNNMEEESSNPLPTASEANAAAKASTSQEQAAKASTSQEQTAKPSTSQEQTAKASTTQERADKASTSQEQAAKASTSQEHVAKASTSQEQAAKVSISQEQATKASTSQEQAAKASVSQEQSTLKSCLASEIHFPKNKRKRGERKAGSGGWNRKMPGEPDSQ